MSFVSWHVACPHVHWYMAWKYQNYIIDLKFCKIPVAFGFDFYTWTRINLVVDCNMRPVEDSAPLVSLNQGKMFFSETLVQMWWCGFCRLCFWMTMLWFNKTFRSFLKLTSRAEWTELWKHAGRASTASTSTSISHTQNWIRHLIQNPVVGPLAWTYLTCLHGNGKM